MKNPSLHGVSEGLLGPRRKLNEDRSEVRFKVPRPENTGPEDSRKLTVVTGFLVCPV
jgi:hypothetical protein